MRVIDVALPTSGGARFFNINEHGDLQPILKFLPKPVEFAGEFQRALQVMDGTGAVHDQKARVLALEDAGDALARFENRVVGRLGHGQLRFQRSRGEEPDGFGYAEVLSWAHD